jgi:hypothetical protein
MDSNRPPVAARTILAALFSLGVAVLLFVVTAFVEAGDAGGSPAGADVLVCCATPGNAPVARRAANVLSGAVFDAGSAGVAAFFLGGSPGIAVREADRLGNGEKRGKITV